MQKSLEKLKSSLYFAEDKISKLENIISKIYSYRTQRDKSKKKTIQNHSKLLEMPSKKVVPRTKSAFEE